MLDLARIDDLWFPPISCHTIVPAAVLLFMGATAVPDPTVPIPNKPKPNKPKPNMEAL